MVVRGTPVSRGVYKGSARVVTRLADAELIQKVRYYYSLEASIPVRYRLRDSPGNTHNLGKRLKAELCNVQATFINGFRASSHHIRQFQSSSSGCHLEKRRHASHHRPYLWISFLTRGESPDSGWKVLSTLLTLHSSSTESQRSPSSPARKATKPTCGVRGR